MFNRLIWIVLMMTAVPAGAAWFDAGWPFRREIAVAWEADKPAGGEMALAEVFTAGRHKADGSDVRVATEDGKLVPFKLLGVGPGDQVRVVFSLAKGQKKYAVYFGNAAPPARPRAAEDPPITAGLLLDMRGYPGGRATSAETMLQIWEKAKTPIGQTMVPGLMLGKSPLGDVTQWAARLSGSLNIPADGEYTFAASAHHSGLLTIDGKPVVFAPSLVGDTRFNAKVSLTKGRHAVDFYHANAGGEGILSVVWKKPGSDKFEAIGKEAIGALYVGTPGSLEENRKTLTADFRVEYMGEAFYANQYSHRYRFTANRPKTQPPKYEWDFGDGQSGEGNTVEHVYLSDGVYPIKVTARIGANADSQTTQFPVGRDVSLEKPKVDDVAVQSKGIEGYKLDRLPAAQLPRATLLHERAGRLELLVSAAARFAPLKTGFDGNFGLLALQEATTSALENGRIEAMLRVWESVPPDSPMQPAATLAYGQLLVWRAGEFDKACSLLGPKVEANRKAAAMSTDLSTERLYAQALILNQRAAEGRKILEAMPIEGPREKQAALSGAMARTIEYYVRQSEAEPGEEQWDRWQRSYPADFLEGYSVLLRVRLIEARKQPEVAARVAEAFALAMPTSTYSPSLLDKASKLMASSNPGKSAELRQLLKKRYPEDPLSQESPGGK